jgi:hypothetical protein
MTIHYQNKNGEELMLSGVVHLQNIDDERWSALMDNGKEFIFLTSRIEGIYHEDTKTVNISKTRGAK